MAEIRSKKEAEAVLRLMLRVTLDMTPEECVEAHDLQMSPEQYKRWVAQGRPDELRRRDLIPLQPHEKPRE